MGYGTMQKNTSKELLRAGRKREHTIIFFGFNLWRDTKAAPIKDWHHTRGRTETTEEPVMSYHYF